MVTSDKMGFLNVHPATRIGQMAQGDF